MSDSSGQNGERARIIRKLRERLIQEQSNVREEQPDPSPETKRSLATALADLHSQLIKYADERALRAEWDDRVDINPDRLLEETRVVERKSRRWDQVTGQEVEVPLVEMVSAGDLLQLAEEFELIVKELGFAAPANSLNPLFHIADPEDEDHPEPINDNVPKPGSSPE